MKQLTEKQRQFVSNKAAGMTNRDAAIAAGYAVAGAAVAADKLMHHPAIRAALKATGKATPGVDIKPGNLPAMPRDEYADPKAFLLDVMNLDGLPIAVRADAAKQLLPYMHARIGEVGKKQSKRERAAELSTAGGRKKPKFATKQPPQLTVVRNE